MCFIIEYRSKVYFETVGHLKTGIFGGKNNKGLHPIIRAEKGKGDVFVIKRKTSIELMRFLAVVMVVLIHIRQILYPDNGLGELAFVAVDFFFMVTGYYAVQEVSSEKTSGIASEACDAVVYAWNKAKKIFGLYFFALAIMFVIRTAEKGSFLFSDTIKELFHFKWEFLMIHMAGFNQAPAFNTDYLLGPAWFISSMLLALIPFCFLFRRCRKTFAGVIAPICMAVIYAYTIQNYGTLDVGNQFVFGTMMGNYRAFAGLSAGAFAVYLSAFHKRLPDLKGGKAFLGIMDVFSWIAAVSLFVFPKDVIPDSDMVFWLIPFSFILLNGNNDLGPVSRWLNHHGCALLAKLGKLSIYIYLLHFQVVMICKHFSVTDRSMAGSLLILAAALAFAAAVMTVREKIRARAVHRAGQSRTHPE